MDPFQICRVYDLLLPNRIRGQLRRCERASQHGHGAFVTQPQATQNGFCAFSCSDIKEGFFSVKKLFQHRISSVTTTPWRSYDYQGSSFF